MIPPEEAVEFNRTVAWNLIHVLDRARPCDVVSYEVILRSVIDAQLVAQGIKTCRGSRTKGNSSGQEESKTDKLNLDPLRNILSGLSWLRKTPH